jgi:hypothetical protein
MFFRSLFALPWPDVSLGNRHYPIDPAEWPAAKRHGG